MKGTKFVFFIFSLFAIDSFSQNNSTSFLLSQIRNQQMVSDAYFVPGVFPSYITNAPRYGEKKPDNNVFYNALIGYTLNKLKPDLNPDDQMVVTQINYKNSAFFPRFKNAKGRMTYNFERTDTAFTYPYSNWISKVRGDLEFPDDLDCTALVLMAEEVPDSVAESVHQLMQNYINKGKNKTAYRSYRKIPAYSSWFGKKFPVVFDVSVLCNVLCFVQENDLKWTAADSASLKLIIKTIQQNDHQKHPRFISPYYPKESLIYYHLARLMSVKPIAELEVLKPLLIKSASKLLTTSHNTLEKVVLNSALIKWGEQPLNLKKTDEELMNEVHKSDFSFFAGNIPSYLKQPTKGILTSLKAVQYYHYCSSFNDALLLEYVVLRDKKK